MKKLLTAILLYAGLHATAQDLTYKIPKEAMAVASVKGNKFLELCSIGEFNNSLLGKKILKEFNKKNKGTQYNSAENLGVQLDGTVYYYNLQTDSIGYNCFLFPLADATRFEHLLDDYEKEIKRNGTTRSLYNKSDKAFLQWDEHTALLVIGSLKLPYFEADSARSARYGIKQVSYGDYYRDEYSAEAAADTVAAVAVDTAVAEPADKSWDTVADVAAVDEGTKDTAWTVADPPAPAEPDILISAPPVTAATPVDEVHASIEISPNAYDQEAYDRDLAQQRELQGKLTREWVTRFATGSFTKTSGPSILDNPDFLRSQDKNAAATFYLSEVQSLYNSLSMFYYAPYRYPGMNALMQGYGSINARLYLDKDKAYINSEMLLDEKKAATYKKIYAHKPNKQFARYINSDKLIGFMSYSFDTEHYLQELPDMLKPAFTRILGTANYSEEANIGAELLSLLLDEKAVSKVIKGDAVLLFTDVGPKEYTYTTYEYNDDYERKEVTKTKTETLPDFLFMMSSEDPHIIERLLNYGVRKERITLKNGIYTLGQKLTKDAPFRFHVLIKDGIVFCGTSYRDIQQIAAGTYQGNISKEQKDLLLKSNCALYFNPKSVIGKIPREEFGSYRKLEDLNTLLGNMGPLYARTTGIKGNRISGELVAQVPESKENALKYFFSLVEYAAKLNRR